MQNEKNSFPFCETSRVNRNTNMLPHATTKLMLHPTTSHTCLPQYGTHREKHRPRIAVIPFPLFSVPETTE